MVRATKCPTTLLCRQRSLTGEGEARRLRAIREVHGLLTTHESAWRERHRHAVSSHTRTSDDRRGASGSCRGRYVCIHGRRCVFNVIVYINAWDRTVGVTGDSLATIGSRRLGPSRESQNPMYRILHPPLQHNLGFLTFTKLLPSCKTAQSTKHTVVSVA